MTYEPKRIVVTGIGMVSPLGMGVQGNWESLIAGSLPARRGFGVGQYTDDSQLARELLVSFTEIGKFDPEHYARRISRLFSENLVVGRGPDPQGGVGGGQRLDGGRRVPGQTSGASVQTPEGSPKDDRNQPPRPVPSFTTPNSR